MKELQNENLKTFNEETEGANKWKDILCSWIERISSAKMFILPKYTHSMQFLQKCQRHFSQTEQTVLTFVRNHKGPQTAKGILRKENSSWRKLTP